jgi:hypothetical protein
VRATGGQEGQDTEEAEDRQAEGLYEDDLTVREATGL